MSAKSVLSAVVGFFNHHVDDLNALSGTLTAILDALPVNAETRSHIKDMIDRVETSATNIANALENTTFGPDPVTIRESDVETALAGVVKSGALDSLISQAVAEYIAAHPTVAPEPVKTEPDSTDTAEQTA